MNNRPKYNAISLIGYPGVDPDTFARMIQQEKGYGVMSRSVVLSNPDSTNRYSKSIIELKGTQDLDDTLIANYVRTKLNDCYKREMPKKIVLSGMPNGLYQLNELTLFTKIELMIYLHLDQNVAVARMRERGLKEEKIAKLIEGFEKRERKLMAVFKPIETLAVTMNPNVDYRALMQIHDNFYK